MVNAGRNAIFGAAIAAALRAISAASAATSDEINRANEELMRSFLGVEASRGGLDITDRGTDRSSSIEAGDNRGVEGLTTDIQRFRVNTPQPGSRRLINLFEKRRVKAVKGDVVAQLNLGLMYARGEGVAKNIEAAAKWLRRPAEQGYAQAQFELAEIYASKNGPLRNYEEAAAWYLKAAEQGNEMAQYKVGIMYAEGIGTRYNPFEAEKWLRKAAEQGNAKIQFNLGERYASGQGVPHNSKEAEKWYRAAAGQGDPDMQFFLGRLYREPGEVVRQDGEEAVLWFGRAAEQGHAAAKLNLGVMYLNGEGIQIDMVQAHKWLTLSAASGSENEAALKNLKVAEERMSEDQIKESQHLVAEWKTTHK